MKKILLTALALSALAALTACGRTEGGMYSTVQSVSEYVHPIVKTPPESEEESAESSSETSDTSSESEPEKMTECPYKVGDLVGPEDLPSRGRAAYIVTITEIYPLDESRNKSKIEIYDEHDELLYRNRYGDVYVSYEYGTDGQILREYESADEYTDIEYDDNGLDVKRTTSRDGRVTMISNISYDEHGEMSEWVSDYYNDDGTSVLLVYLKYENQYDENDRQIVSTSYDIDGNVRESTVREYYDDGTLKLSRRTTPDDNGGIKEIYEWLYDTSGKMSGRRVTYYNENGEVSSSVRVELSYNADGKLAECLTYNTEDILEHRTVYEYIYANQEILNRG